ncbi:hypothetical protein [Thermocrinis sp.]
MKRSEAYRNFGVRLEERYIIYETKNGKMAIPYAHIACVSFSDSLVVIQTNLPKMINFI